jgi:hypothetical protein
VPQYFGEANQKEIRQYAEIIAMTDDVYKIANYLEISEQIIHQVKEHIFIIAPHTSKPNPFSHWVKIIGKSAEGLMLADNLSNLDELLEAIRERI